ncbi:MAG: helix-turn-helix domain-containing protein [Candidatus Aminicenantes bacterium]|nr:helix-turn-helix domain-containing protein [Candidatus Aminicenantes bacterium]
MQTVLPHKIRKAREAARLSQGAFARALGLSSEYISLLEAGKRTPSMATLHKISGFLNRDIGYFFYEKPAPPDAFTLLFRAESVDDRTREELQKFRRYCDDYLRLEIFTGRKLELAPLYGPNTAPEHMADEERRRLGLGQEPIRDVFSLFESNGCRILRMPMPADSKVSGVFIYLEAKGAAFALVNSAQSVGRQAFSAAHEYCHYLKDRSEGPVIDNPDVFVDEYASLYHPREPFAQAFAARFLMPPAKIREMVEKEFRSQRVGFDEVLYLKRYFGVSTLAMLRTLRSLGYVSKAQSDEFARIEPAAREKELFGNLSDGNGEGGGTAGAVGGWIAKFRRRPLPSDRYKLLQREAMAKIARDRALRKAVQKTLPAGPEEAGGGLDEQSD